MSKNIPKGLLIFAGIFFWCLITLVQLFLALLATLAVTSAYAWAFSITPVRGYRSKNLVQPLEDVGYGWSAAIFIVCFVVIKGFYWAKNREDDQRRDELDLDQTADLKSSFGDSSVSEPEGIGYVTKVIINGKEFEGGHQTLTLPSRHQKINTASAFVRFKIADTKLEMRIAQKSFWITPKKEPLSLGLTHESEPVEVLSHRYDCTWSDRDTVIAFLADEDVKRELLPKFPNSYERFTLIVKNGEVRLECTADTKSDRHVAEAATYGLMKKLLKRAEIFDRRLAEMSSK